MQDWSADGAGTGVQSLVSLIERSFDFRAGCLQDR